MIFLPLNKYPDFMEHAWIRDDHACETMAIPKLDRVVQLVADQPNATSPLGKIRTIKQNGGNLWTNDKIWKSSKIENFLNMCNLVCFMTFCLICSIDYNSV